MHEIMGNTLGSLYTCPRGLFRRRRSKLGITVRSFLWSNSTNFCVAPCIISIFSSLTVVYVPTLLWIFLQAVFWQGPLKTER